MGVGLYVWFFMHLYILFQLYNINKHVYILIIYTHYTNYYLFIYNIYYIYTLVQIDHIFIFVVLKSIVQKLKFLPEWLLRWMTTTDSMRLDPLPHKKSCKRKVCEINFPNNSHFYNVRFKDGLRACVANGCRFEYCLLVATIARIWLAAQRMKQ